MLLCPQEFEKREYEPTTWLRTSVESTKTPPSDSDILKAHGQLKSFVEKAQKNIKAEGLFVPETCYCAVRSGHKYHREERKKKQQKKLTVQ